MRSGRTNAAGSEYPATHPPSIPTLTPSGFSGGPSPPPERSRARTAPSTSGVATTPKQVQPPPNLAGGAHGGTLEGRTRFIAGMCRTKREAGIKPPDMYELHSITKPPTFRADREKPPTDENGNVAQERWYNLQRHDTTRKQPTTPTRKTTTPKPTTHNTQNNLRHKQHQQRYSLQHQRAKQKRWYNLQRQRAKQTATWGGGLF